MCGIAGIVALDGVDAQMLTSMTHLVSHRGPDGFGFAYFPQGSEYRGEIIHNQDGGPVMQRPVVGLGSRRLAILDLSEHGNMPMQVEDGALCVTYNGEIYNYREVRTELEKCGYDFRTGTDTEVLLRAYQHWGKDCLQHFNGMFAFALWDRSRQTLFCARDRFGVKPFYYALHEGRFYLGSEIKQLVHGAQLPRTANPRVVYQFLERSTTDYSNETFFENIYQLPGGHALTVRLNYPLEISVWKYWELMLRPVEESAEQDGEAICEEFKQLWQDAVKLRLRSDVPVGVSLSGGIDSSAVTCEARRLSPQQEFHTFSSCIEDPSMDERRYIASVGKAIDAVQHLVYPLSPDFWANIDTVMYHQDEPFPSGGIYAQWCVMAEARKQNIPVLLGGQGGDEALCGYQKYRYFYLWDMARRGDLGVVREALLSLRNGTRSSWQMSDASRYFPAPFRNSFSVLERVGVPGFKDSFEDQLLNLGAMGSIPERQKMDLTLSSIPALLHLEDRNAMAHSIETRLPLMDYKLLEFAVNCPAKFKLHDGWSKWLLREAMKGAMPEDVRLRKSKLGFDVPQKGWMVEGLSNGRRDVWAGSKLRMERFLDARRVLRETQRFLNADRGAMPADFLFRAISLEIWARVHNVN